MKKIARNILALFGLEEEKSPALSDKKMIIHDGFGGTIELILID